jgi:hypothetical protein
MSKIKPPVRLATPLVPARKDARKSVPSSGHAKRVEADKQALLELEQSLRLQSYTIRLPHSHPLFSGKDMRRTAFPSSPVHIVMIQKDK